MLCARAASFCFVSLFRSAVTREWSTASSGNASPLSWWAGLRPMPGSWRRPGALPRGFGPWPPLRLGTRLPPGPRPRLRPRTGACPRASTAWTPVWPAIRAPTRRSTAIWTRSSSQARPPPGEGGTRSPQGSWGPGQGRGLLSRGPRFGGARGEGLDLTGASASEGAWGAPAVGGAPAALGATCAPRAGGAAVPAMRTWSKSQVTSECWPKTRSTPEAKKYSPKGE